MLFDIGNRIREACFNMLNEQNRNYAVMVDLGLENIQKLERGQVKGQKDGLILQIRRNMLRIYPEDHSQTFPIGILANGAKSFWCLGKEARQVIGSLPAGIEEFCGSVIRQMDRVSLMEGELIFWGEIRTGRITSIFKMTERLLALDEVSILRLWLGKESCQRLSALDHLCKYEELPHSLEPILDTNLTHEEDDVRVGTAWVFVSHQRPFLEKMFSRPNGNVVIPGGAEVWESLFAGLYQAGMEKEGKGLLKDLNASSRYQLLPQACQRLGGKLQSSSLQNLLIPCLLAVPNKHTLSYFGKTLSQPDRELQRSTLVAIGQLGFKAGIDMLIEFMGRSQDPELLETAEESIRKIKQHLKETDDRKGWLSLGKSADQEGNLSVFEPAE